MAAEDFIITRKRKKYKFARFAERENCFEAANFTPDIRDGFIGDAPLTLELGAGTGLFAVALARRWPGRRFIAMDVKADRLQTGAKVASEQGLKNICFLRAHASQLTELFQAQSLGELWLTFPDPYPKKRHAKHRMTHPDFLGIYRRLLMEKGVFHLKTDNHALFEWSLEQLVAERARLKFLSFDLHQSEAPADYKIMTTYEQRYTSEGAAIVVLDAQFC